MVRLHQFRVATQGGCSGQMPHVKFSSTKSASKFKFPSYTSNGKITFLSSEFPYQKVALASFSRSGNSMMRTLLQEVTRFYTGSEMRLDAMNETLMAGGLRGEEVVDERVWIVKTHFPATAPGDLEFEAPKAILIVRNPFDSFNSLFHLAVSGSHTGNASDDAYKVFRKHWLKYVTNNVGRWQMFHDFWLSAGVPTVVLRYEDLIVDSRPGVELIFKSLLGEQEYVSSGLQDNVTEYYEDQERKRTSYKPRQGGIFKSLTHYEPEQLQEVLVGLQPQLSKFGYLSKDFLSKGDFSALSDDFMDSIYCEDPCVGPFLNQGADEKMLRINDDRTCQRPKVDYFGVIRKDAAEYYSKQECETFSV